MQIINNQNHTARPTFRAWQFTVHVMVNWLILFYGNQPQTRQDTIGPRHETILKLITQIILKMTRDL